LDIVSGEYHETSENRKGGSPPTPTVDPEDSRGCLLSKSFQRTVEIWRDWDIASIRARHSMGGDIGR
jgi:hypothetical protein